MNFLFLMPYAIAAAVGFGAAWQWQELTITQIQSEHKDERIASQRAARAQAERQITQAATANTRAQDRAGQLAVVVGDSRTELERLRSATDAAMRAASASFEACTAHAATADTLLSHCAVRLVEVAAAADGHVSDLQTLDESWPP